MTTTTEPTARSVRKATMNLGLVSVPVKLYTTSESTDEIKFNMLHDADHAQLKQQYVCTKCGVVVDREHTVKGHEHTKGQFVVFAKEEMEALDSIDDGIMVVREFIKPAQLDPVYMAEEKCFYLGPDQGAELAYALVLEAMEESDRIAVATYARGGKERLVAVRAVGQLLVLHELRYASEVRGVAGVPVAGTTAKPQLVKLAREMIERMSLDAFIPERYTDSVAERRRALIKAKIDAGETIAPSPKATPANVTDMLEALKASLDTVPARKRVSVNRDRKSRVKAVAKKRKVS